VAVEGVDVTLHLTHADDGAMLIRRTLASAARSTPPKKPLGRDRRKDPRHAHPQGGHANRHRAGLTHLCAGSIHGLSTGGDHLCAPAGGMYVSFTEEAILRLFDDLDERLAASDAVDSVRAYLFGGCAVPPLTIW
jgi:hypothetical protein